MSNAFGIKTQLDKEAIRKTKNEFGKALEDMKKMGDSNSVKIKFDSYENQFKKMSSGFEGITQGSKNFASSMGHVITRVGEFAIGIGTVYGTLQKVKEGFGFIYELDTKLTDIGMITGKSKSELNGYAKEWNKLAIDLKTDTNEVVNAQEKYLRAGKSINEANKMVETNIKLSRIADEQNADTAEYLIALSNAYGLNAEGVEKYANKVAYLDSSTATSTSNINKSMLYTAQTAKETGMGMDFLLGIISTIQEKSKMGAEAIGRSVKSMFLNIQKIQEGKDINGLSKLEDTLNKQGIALRKNEKEWRSSEAIIRDIMAQWSKWDDITKSRVSQLIAGKNQAEQFGIIMNDNTRVMENYNNSLHATNTLNEKYENHLNSAKGAMDELKATTQKYWMDLINSNFIISAIKDVKTLVNVISYLTIENKKLGISYVALSAGALLTVKNFGKIKFAVGEVIAFMQLLKTEGLATLTLLSFNPITLAIIGVVGAIGAATYAITRHIKHVKELEENTKKATESYNELNKAMAENNMQGLKDNIKETKKLEDGLKAAIKEKKEADKILNTYKSNSINMLDSGGYGQARANLDLANKKLEEQIAVLKKAKIAFDETTGEIKELAQAENLLKANNLADSIKKKEEAKIKELDKTLELINSYNNLNAIEKKSATQKAELGTLALQLKDRINGLRVATDEHGNTVIVNTDLLAKEASMIDTEKGAVINSTNARLASAKDDYTIEVGKTKVVYSEVSKRISMYQAEADALRGLATKYEQADKLIRVGLDDNNPLKKKQNPLSEMLSGRAKELDKESSALSDAKKKIDEAFSKKTPGISDIGGSSGGGGSSGYMPPSGGDDKKKKKAKSDADKRKREAEEAERKRKEALKKALDDAINQYDYAIKTIENKIANARNRMELYTEDGDKWGNRVVLTKQIETFTNQKISQLEAKKRFIQNSINSGKYEADTVKDLKSKILDIDGALSDVYTSLKKIKVEIIDETYKQKTVEIVKEVERLKNKMEEIDSADTFNKQKLNYMDSMIEKIKQQRNVTQSYVNELERQIRATRDIATRSALEDSIKKYREELQSLQIEIIKSMTDRKNLIKDLTFEIEKLDEFNRVIEETNENLRKHNYLLADLDLQIELLKEKMDFEGVDKLYGDYISAMNGKIVELRNQSKELSSAMDGLQKEFKLKFGVDISSMSKKDLNNLYQSMFATRVTGSKEEKEALEKQAELFKRLMDDYYQLTEAIQENGEALGGMTNEILKKQKEQADYILNLQKELQDKAKDMMLKHKDDEKKVLDERLKNFKEFIDKRQKELDKTWKQEDYDRDLQKKKEEEAKIIAEIESKRRDTSLQGKAEVKRLEEELAKIQEDISNFERDHNRDMIKENLNDQLEKADKENEEANKKLDEFYSDKNLNQMSYEAIAKGYFKDIHGNTIMLKDAMIDYIKTTSDGLSVIGQKIQDEIIAKLIGLQQFFKDGLNFGGISNIGTPISNPTVMNPIGGGIGGNGSIDISKLIGGSIGNIQPIFNNPIMPVPIINTPMGSDKMNKEIKIYVDSINRVDGNIYDRDDIMKMMEEGGIKSTEKFENYLISDGKM